MTPEPRPISVGSVSEADLRSVGDTTWRGARAKRSETPLAEAIRRLRKSTAALIGVAIVVALVISQKLSPR